MEASNVRKREEAGMTDRRIGFGAIAMVAVGLLGIGSPSDAQFNGREDPMPVTAPKLAEPFWSAKPTSPTPYVAPNRPHWKLAEILAAHRGQSDWVQPIVRNP